MVPVEFVEHFQTNHPGLIGQRVLVAFSGGADSVALLHLLRSEALALNLEAAHVHHGLRGDEADDDARFCEVLCSELGIPFHLLRLDISAPRTSGREGTWRELRYQALLDLKRQGNFQAVATGHHRDDVAEGVMMQLLRGGGPRALAGIESTTPSGVIRPLLPWTRKEITSWLAGRDLGWREDSSNEDLGLLRNRVRHEVLPELEEISPSIRHHLVNLAEALAVDEKYFAEKLRTLNLWIEPWEPQGGVALRSIQDLPAPLQTRWLHAQARMIGVPRVTRPQLKLFRSMIGGGPPRTVTLGGRWRLRPARGFLWLEPPHPPPPYAIDLELGVTADLPFPGWTARFGPDDPERHNRSWQFRPPEGARLQIRNARDSDVVVQDGAEVRARKIIARALPRHLRTAWPLCCEDDKIYWIPEVWRGPENPNQAGHVVEVIRSGRSSCIVQR